MASEGSRRDTAGWGVWMDGRIRSDVRPNEQGDGRTNDSQLTTHKAPASFRGPASQRREDTIIVEIYNAKPYLPTLKLVFKGVTGIMWYLYLSGANFVFTIDFQSDCKL
jgi:hypothetical protein